MVLGGDVKEYEKPVKMPYKLNCSDMVYRSIYGRIKDA